MAKLDQTIPFETEEAAQKAATLFEATYGGAQNPYEGRATVEPPKPDRATWLVHTSRRRSAD